MKIESKVVVVTGASEGIGAACARAFAKRGAKLSLNALPQSNFEYSDKDTLIIPGDLTRDDVRSQLVERTLERFGRIDILINNAGVGIYAPAWKTPLESAKTLFDLNVFAVLGMAQLVVPPMQKAGKGMIVNIGSIGGKVTLPWATLYCASKYAVHSISEGLYRELRPLGIHVMTVVPGIIATRFREHVLFGKVPDRVADLRWVVPAERLAESIAEGVEKNARVVTNPWISHAFFAADLLFPKIMDLYCDRKG